MPNQYTKFKAASQSSALLEFRWREYTGKKQKRPLAGKKHTAQLDSGYEKCASSDEGLSRSRRRRPSAYSPSASLLQYMPSGGLRVDPFRAYPVAADKSELAVLDHFLHILSPSGKQNYMVVHRRRTKHVDPHIKLLLPYVMQDAALFDALLATCQASIIISRGMSAYDDRFFMLHRGRAMSRLREKLEHDIDTTAMLSVSMLITCDYLTGDLKAVEDHAKALQRMVNHRGTLPDSTPWDRFVKSGVEGYKSIGYLATGRLPPEDLGSIRSHLDTVVDPFTELIYPRPPFSSDLCSRWSALPTGFSDLILSSQIATQLIAIICAIDDVQIDNNEDLLRTLDLVQPIQAALQRFHQHVHATHLERCIAAGLLAYTFQFPRLQMPNMFHDPPMQGFVRIFSIPHRSSSTVEHEALMWAQMSIEGFASTRSSRLPGSRAIFSRALTKSDVMRDWCKLEPVTQKYFCTLDILERWRTCHSCFAKETIDECTTISDALSTQTPTSLSVRTLKLPVPNVCPFSGQVAGSTTDGMVLQCPFGNEVTS